MKQTEQTAEALAVFRALEPMIEKKIDEMTRSCVRRKKATVTTAPENGVVGVTEPYGTEFFVPYVSTLSSVAVGTSIWLEWSYSMSNCVAVAKGSGT